MKLTIIELTFKEDGDLTEEEKEKILDEYLGAEYITDEVENDYVYDEVSEACRGQIDKFKLALRS